MLKLFNRYRKGVSPVIAVVLLIALTVAAAAVIWAITSGFLGATDATIQGQVESRNYDSGADLATVTMSLESTEDATITNAVLTDGTNELPNSSISISLTANQETIETFEFQGNNVTVTGQWDLRLTFNVEGNNQIETFEVSFP